MIVSALSMQAECGTHLFWVPCFKMSKGILLALRELPDSQRKGESNINHMYMPGSLLKGMDPHENESTDLGRYYTC